MQFVKPQLFNEALDKIGARSVVGAQLDSAAWSQVPVALRERAFFSSEVENVRFLQRAKDSIADFLSAARDESGALATGSRADFVARMQEFALAEGMGPLEPKQAGGLQDITSERRLGLIFDVQTRQAQDFGYWKQGLDPDVLAEFPAQRFIRTMDVQDPRAWHQQFEDGVWLKSDLGAWQRINQDFGVPWGPWGWGCGHDVEDVDRDEAEALGLIKPGQKLPDVSKDFNERLEASARGLDADLLQQLRSSLGDRIEIQGDTVRWRGQENSTRPAPSPAPEPAPAAPPALPVEKPRPSLEDSLRAAGIDGSSPVTKHEMRALLEELKEDAPVHVDEVLLGVKNADKYGALTAAGVRERVQEFLEFFPPELVRSLPKLRIEIKPIDANGTYSMGGVLQLHPVLSASPANARRVIFHELMHWIHREGPEDYRAAITAHFEARTAGEKVVQLAGYKSDTRGKRDKWYESYAGRIYGFERSGEAGLEVPTRYIEWMTMQPGQMAALWNDASFRETMLVVLKGLF